MMKLLAATITALAFGVASATGTADPLAPPVTGEVLEVRDAGAFTYLRLKTGDGEVWAGVKRAAVTPGARVTIDDPVVMRNFESKALQRRFDILVFGSLAAGAGGAGTGGPTNAPAAPRSPAAAHGDASATRDIAVTKVAKAEGPDARSVAEVHAQRTALAGRPVTVRARVVKVTPGVMGKNWIHLRDGSGSDADASNDLVVTSGDEPRVGDVVIARGVVRTDVNLGSGYAYQVLVEEASVRQSSAR